MPIQPEPDRVGRVSVGLPEGPTPVRIPQVEIKVIDEGHLAAPFQVGVPRPFLAFAFPRAPDRGFLLRDADQDDPTFTTLPGRRLDQVAGDSFLVLALGEVAHGNALGLGPAVDVAHIGSPISPKAAEEGIGYPRCPFRNRQT